MIEQVKVLDHGYIVEVESWGSEEGIIEAARMSTAKGFLGWGPRHASTCARQIAVEDCPHHYGPWRDTAEATSCTCEPGPGDEKLLAFLWKNKHATPFEMAGMTIEVQAPIFVFREWHRHRVPFSYNEMSARYTPLPDMNYVPTVERLMMSAKGQAGHPQNKQAGTVKDAAVLTEELAKGFQEHIRESYRRAQDIYDWALKAGVPKELARVHLPVGRYSRMRASANLRGWLAFLALRSDKNPGAQYEIRQYANALHDILKAKFPRTLALFDGEE